METQELIAFLQFAAEHAEIKRSLMRNICFEDFMAIASERGYDLGSMTSGEIKQTVLQLAAKTTTTTGQAQRQAGVSGQRSTRSGRRDHAGSTVWLFCQRWPD